MGVGGGWQHLYVFLCGWVYVGGRILIPQGFEPSSAPFFQSGGIYQIVGTGKDFRATEGN